MASLQKFFADSQEPAARSFFWTKPGFKQVDLALVARILKKLPRAEVILTFASDALINFLTDRPQLINAVAPLELTQSQIQEMIEFRSGDGGRALAQRVLLEHFRITTGATYYTPFFIRPKQSHRALWFLHLSRHPIARDVMIQCHWDNSNIFEHYGSGDFDMLGWDALHTGNLPLFNFTDFDAERMREQLLHSMPLKLHALAADEPITIDGVRHMLANKTAARFSDLDKIVLSLAREREFNILGPNGKVRSRNLTRLDPTDPDCDSCTAPVSWIFAPDVVETRSGIRLPPIATFPQSAAVRPADHVLQRPPHHSPTSPLRSPACRGRRRPS